MDLTNVRIQVHNTAQKMKFSIKDFFSKCDQIRSFLRICSHLLKKSLMENFIFCKGQLKISEGGRGFFILMDDFVIIYIHFGIKQQPVSLKITTAALLIIRKSWPSRQKINWNRTWSIHQVLLNGQSMWIFDVVKASLVFIKNSVLFYHRGMIGKEIQLFLFLRFLFIWANLSFSILIFLNSLKPVLVSDFLISCFWNY